MLGELAVCDVLKSGGDVDKYSKELHIMQSAKLKRSRRTEKLDQDQSNGKYAVCLP